MKSGSPNYRHDENEASIQDSLHRLKQLEQLLQSKHYSNYPPSSGSKPHNYTHTRVKTEPYEFNFKNNGSFGPVVAPFDEKLERIQEPLRSPHTNTYTHSQPTMVEHNQNNHNSVQSIIKQNRKLKKYVNCLLQMNDYLKNQLVKKDMMTAPNKMGHSFQLQLMKMEIDYLKQLNREKQLQIQKNNSKNHLGIYSKSKKKTKNKFQYVQALPQKQFQHSHHLRGSSHHRSSSTCDMAYRNAKSQFSIAEQQEEEGNNYNQSQQSEHKYLKNKAMHQVDKQNSRKSSAIPSKQSIKYSKNKSVCQNYGPQQKNSKSKCSKQSKKCRLCYI